MQRKLTRGRKRSRANVVEMDIDGTPPFLRASEAAPRPCGWDTLPDTIGNDGNSTCEALRRADSVTSTDIREGLGKGDDIGIPFGNTRARWNKRSVLHFNANEKVPRRIKSPRSFISREKPEVERCGWVWILVWVEEVPPRRRRRKGGVAIGVRVQAYPHSLGWTAVLAEGRGELRINGQVDK